MYSFLKVFIFVMSRKLIYDTKYNKMISLKNSAKSKDSTSEMQVQMELYNTTATFNEERANQLEQDYYNKACGCSVKAQENNLFDYKSQLKNQDLS